jgi:hypothetical protein
VTSVFRAGGHKKFESLRINLSDLISQQGCARDPGHFQPWNPGTRPGTTPGIPSKKLRDGKGSSLLLLKDSVLEPESTTRPNIDLRLRRRLFAIIVGQKLGVDVTEEQKRERGRVLNIILRQPQALTFLGESTKPSHKTGSRSIESGIFRNIVKSHPKTTFSVRQVEGHVYPGLGTRIPTVCMLIRTLFQERVNYFTGVSGAKACTQRRCRSGA